MSDEALRSFKEDSVLQANTVFNEVVVTQEKNVHSANLPHRFSLPQLPSYLSFPFVCHLIQLRTVNAGSGNRCDGSTKCQTQLKLISSRTVLLKHIAVFYLKQLVLTFPPHTG